MIYDEIKQVCEKYGIKNWKINPMFDLVDVYSRVNLSYINLKKIPLNFGNISDDFDIGGNKKLSSLHGCPQSIEKSFIASGLNITIFDYLPTYIGKNFYCSDNNKLTTLKGIEKTTIDGNFYCDYNTNLPTWEYRWLFYAEINGDIVSGNRNLNDYFKKWKNCAKKDLPKAFIELKELGKRI